MRTETLLPYLIGAVPVCLLSGICVFIALGMSVSAVRAIFRSRRRVADLWTPTWAQAAYSLWTGGEDCGMWEPGRARQSLASWYGATDKAKFLETIQELRDGQTGNVAWDLVRALDLLRIGTAAGFLTPEECWGHTREIARVLQGKYGSWEALGQDFEAGMLAWHDRRGVTDPAQRGKVQQNLPMLRATLWPMIAWETRL